MVRSNVAARVWLFCLMCGSPAAAGDAFTLVPDVVYGHKAGMALTFDVARPAEQNGAGVLFLVSGGWNSFWMPPESVVRVKPEEPNQFEQLVQRGYTLFLVRHGSAPQFKVPEAVDDVRRAVRFVRKNAADFGIDPQRIGVMGGSAGGHLSLMLGTTGDDGVADSKDPIERVSSRVQAVVAYFPPTRIDEFFKLKDRFPALDFDPALADSVSPLLHVSPDDAPALLLHGDKDDLVPLSNSERIHEAFQQHGVASQLIVMEGAGHSFSGPDRQRAETAMLEWFDQRLAP